MYNGLHFTLSFTELQLSLNKVNPQKGKTSNGDTSHYPRLLKVAYPGFALLNVSTITEGAVGAPETHRSTQTCPCLNGIGSGAMRGTPPPLHAALHHQPVQGGSASKRVFSRQIDRNLLLSTSERNVDKQGA